MRWSTIPRHDRVTPQKENGRSSSENRRSIHPRLPPLRTGARAKKRKRSKGAGGKGGIGEPENRGTGDRGDRVKNDRRVALTPRDWIHAFGVGEKKHPPSLEPFHPRKEPAPKGNGGQGPSVGGWGKYQAHDIETAPPSDPPARVLRSPWHPGYKTPILKRESALIPPCTPYPPFPGPAFPACRGEPAPESPYRQTSNRLYPPRVTVSCGWFIPKSGPGGKRGL